MKLTESIERFNSGQADASDLKAIEAAIASGTLDLHQLEGYAELFAWYKSVLNTTPSTRMDDAFYAGLSDKKKRLSQNHFSWLTQRWTASPVFRWAYSLLLVLIGLGIGVAARINGEIPANDMAALSAEVRQMKEMMMLTLLEKESTSDRLRAVHLTGDMGIVSHEITTALFETLNNDDNVNVRLATLEALYPYADNPYVRKGLIQSIGRQDSPMVQIALAEMMVALQEKDAVDDLKLLLEKEDTPDEVKHEIEKNINFLI